MRRAANVDGNHGEVVKRLRQCGVSVQPLHTVGSGCPDLVCGFRGVNVLIEVKDGGKNPAKRELNQQQKDWHAAWAGQVAVAETPEDALLVVYEAARKAGKV